MLEKLKVNSNCRSCSQVVIIYLTTSAKFLFLISNYSGNGLHLQYFANRTH